MQTILVIGSGPIVIGQAAEFDYAGTQACKALREEGYRVALINSNPATIMTDPETADAVYIEPLTVEFCERVIERERPFGLLPTLGGQTGLNLASQVAAAGILEKYNVRLLGTPLSAIQKAEDREQFRSLMHEIKEPVPESFIVETPEQLQKLLGEKVPDENGRLIDFPYPRIVRPAYTLGGTGGGIAHTPEELWDIGSKGLKLSMRSQIMIERSLLGWKEVEYEVMRDSAGNCITVCNMENFDPMGVHTGDSIVVAPSQTLSDIEYHMLRSASLKIIRALGIEGGCNVQLAVNPDSFDYYVIEVNPRVSRSSALASKATGYPIARVAAKIAAGRTLDEIENQVTRSTKACFEPALDYCVVKIPRWPFDKFPNADRTLFTQMKATGEVMAIGRTFEEALLKAIRGLEVQQKGLEHPKFAAMEDIALRDAIRIPTDERIWAILEGLRRGWTVEDIQFLSHVDRWFLRKLLNLIFVEKRLWEIRLPETVPPDVVKAFEITIPNHPDMPMFTTNLTSDELWSIVKDETESPWRRRECERSLVTNQKHLIGLAKVLGVRLDALRCATTFPLDQVFRFSQLKAHERWVEWSVTQAINCGFSEQEIKEIIGLNNQIHHAGSALAKAVNFAIESAFAEYEYVLTDFLAENHYESDDADHVSAFMQQARILQPLANEFRIAMNSQSNRSEINRDMHDWELESALNVMAVWLKVFEQTFDKPVYKMVDTCAGEFESATPYYYATHETEDEMVRKQ